MPRIINFKYTIQSGDYTPDLDYVDTSSITLNGGTIQNGGDNAILTLPTPGSAGSLGYNKDIYFGSPPVSTVIPLTGVQIMRVIPNSVYPDKLVSESDNGELFVTQKNNTSARVEETTLNLQIRATEMQTFLNFVKSNYITTTVQFTLTGVTPFLNATESNDCLIVNYTTPVKSLPRQYTMSITLRAV